MGKIRLSSVAVLLGAFSIVVSCSSGPTRNTPYFGTTLRDYARRAQQRGSRESLVPYAADEQEGEWLNVRSIDEAMEEYEWIVGEPVEERALTIATATNSTDPDAIFTLYRLRVTRRLGRSKHPSTTGPLEKIALQERPVANNEVLVLKSGGDAIVDGILLKKRGSPCFSELLPRTYLLALATDPSGRIGWLAMGCKAIFALDGDRLRARDQEGSPVTLGMKNRFSNSLATFSRAFESSHPARQ